MADYLLPLQFGIFPTPESSAVAETLELAALADTRGLELIGVQDHPYQARHLDAWTLLSVIAARTERVRVVPDVACLPLRPPAMLAKAAASLDVLSGGRVELGLGAGAFWEAIEAMGGPPRTPREAVAALEEAIVVCRLMWSGRHAVHYDGHHNRLSGVHPGPAPAHPVGIWLGAIGPRMLALTGRAADGWLPSSAYVPPEKLLDAHARIDDAAAAAGRAPEQVRRVYNVFGEIADPGRGRAEFLRGPAEQWVDELTGLAVEHGMDTFVFGPAADPVTQVNRFAEDVVPAVREAVARHRACS